VNLSALPELLLSWVKNQGAALLQGDKAQPPSFQAGQQYEGKVIDNLVNGRHLVRVGSQMLDMNLPAKTQPGETVRLTYINAGPRPTFLLNLAAISPIQQVQISNTAQQVNALLRLAQVPVASAQVAANVGTVGASSSRPVANAAPSSAQPASSRAVPVSTETAKSPGLEANAITKAVATVVANAPTNVAASPSANPVVGMASSRPIVANVMMLQSFTATVQSTTTALTGPNTGLLGQAVDAPRAAVPASTTLSANTLVELPSSSRHMLPVRLSQTLSESGMFYESHLAKWSNGSLSLEAILREPQARMGQEPQVQARLADLGGMPEEAARLAGRQLQMLEGGPFLWQGLAWPGQAMEWQVREEPGGDGGGETGEASSEWVTELNLTLPRMGSVHAQLGLTGERLRLRLLAAEPTTREALNAALPLLAKGFEASGLQPVDMQVEASRVSV
jgi:flagellar hook-length control protein FliK